MTSPDGEIPEKAVTQAEISAMQDYTQEGIAADANADMLAVAEEARDNFFNSILGGFLSVPLAIIAAIAGLLGGFGSLVEAILGTVDNDYVAGLPIITDHSNSIEALEAQLDALILQGSATKIVGNTTFFPADGVLLLDLILLGGGGGGGAGRWDLLAANRKVGGGGGGGGETHTSIPAALLPSTGGVFDGISVTIGAGGSGGTGDAQVGTGGGNTLFGPYLLAGGGNGGSTATATDDTWAGGAGGAGGVGMVPGGDGGNGGSPGSGPAPVKGGDSFSPYSLNGGGGGGGGGLGVSGAPASGGNGALWAGGNPGAAGTPPSAVVATGGGGGGGSPSTTTAGGAGAVPCGGGGGGGGGGGAPKGKGGNGGRGEAYVIERFT